MPINYQEWYWLYFCVYFETGSYTCLKRKFNDSTLEEGGAGRRTEGA